MGRLHLSGGKTAFGLVAPSLGREVTDGID
jgi:hypothetical protein